MALKYAIYFKKDDIPITGITPVAYLYERDTLNVVAGTCSSTLSGISLLTVTAASLPVIGVIDGGATLTSADRYVPVCITDSPEPAYSIKKVISAAGDKVEYYQGAELLFTINRTTAGTDIVWS
jgi:hypothetical protein